MREEIPWDGCVSVSADASVGWFQPFRSEHHAGYRLAESHGLTRGEPQIDSCSNQRNTPWIAKLYSKSHAWMDRSLSVGDWRQNAGRQAGIFWPKENDLIDAMYVQYVECFHLHRLHCFFPSWCCLAVKGKLCIQTYFYADCLLD